MGLGDRIRAFFTKKSNPGLVELEPFVAERKGIEGFIEPKTPTSPTSLLLVDRDGDHLPCSGQRTRRRGRVLRASRDPGLRRRGDRLPEADEGLRPAEQSRAPWIHSTTTSPSSSAASDWRSELPVELGDQVAHLDLDAITDVGNDLGETSLSGRRAPSPRAVPVGQGRLPRPRSPSR